MLPILVWCAGLLNLPSFVIFAVYYWTACTVQVNSRTNPFESQAYKAFVSVAMINTITTAICLLSGLTFRCRMIICDQSLNGFNQNPHN
jgi:uncharacterized membrane protein